MGTAVLWGRPAQRVLARPGRVVAVFERSFYVETDGGLACIGGRALGAGPLNVVLKGDPPSVREGDSAARNGDALRIGHHEIALSAVKTWRAGDAGLVSCVSLEVLRDARAPRASLGALLPELFGNVPAASDPLFAIARPVLIGLRDWAAGGAMPGIAVLVGLGPGLTPAGDDALAGAMIAARQCGAASLADELAASVLQAARATTGKISYAHLAAAADGEGAGALHDVLCALAGRGPLGAALARLDSIGHSSGWDGLAGAAAVLTGLAARHDSTPTQTLPLSRGREERG